IGEDWEYAHEDRYLDEEARQLFDSTPAGTTVIFSGVNNPSNRFYDLYVRDRIVKKDPDPNESDTDRDDRIDRELRRGRRESPRYHFSEIRQALLRAGFREEQTGRTRYGNFLVGVFVKPLKARPT